MSILVNGLWNIGSGWIMDPAIVSTPSTLGFYVWGGNTNGQLGLGDLTNRSSPVQMGNLSNWTQISSASSTMAAIQSPGTLWMAGGNSFNTLGLGDTTQRSTFVQVGSNSNWTVIANGSSRMFGVQSPGTLWAWGSAYQGGLGNNTQYGQPNLANFPNGPDQILSWSTLFGATRASIGSFHACAVQSNGTLWGWGTNSYGQLANSNLGTILVNPTQIGTVSSWSQVACGYILTYAIQSNGTLWGCGYNGTLYTNLGINTATAVNVTSFIQIGAASNWTSITSSRTLTAGLQSPGTLWVWGCNSFGSLGLNTTPNHPVYTPIQIGTNSNWVSVASSRYGLAAVAADGSLWVCGSNSFGQLGINTLTTAVASSLIQVPGSLWTNVYYTLSSIAGIQTPGTLWAWGSNANGQLGLGDITNRSSPVQVGAVTTWTTATINQSILAIKSNGTLWGAGSFGLLGLGQFGDGTSNNLSTFVQVSASTNWTSVLNNPKTTGGALVGVQSDGSLLTAGSGAPYYVLGIPLANAVNTGWSTLPNPVSTGAYSNWSQISVGIAPGNYQLALQSDGSLWGWGYNVYGTMATSNYGFNFTPQKIGSSTWLQISAGIVHAAGIQSNHTLWLWGTNTAGQLGNNSITNSNFAQLSPLQLGSASNWAQVSCGYMYTLALQSNGTLWAWGNNTAGSLGLNTSTFFSSPVQVPGTWKSIYTNSYSVGATQTNGSLWVWGSNASGQLGLGDTTNRSSPVQLGTFSNWSSVQIATAAAGLLV